jgi:hypothetical protein
MNGSANRLYALLPAVHRMRDVEQGYPLRALLAIINEQANVIDKDIGRLYDNWFIETCDNWVVGYIGDLIGYRPVHDAGDPQPPNTIEGARENRILIPRREVANTIALRRRKGTLVVLQELASDVTGWPARAVEFYRLLGWMQHIDHQRPNRGLVVNLRDADALDLISGPFDRVAHTVDVRRVSSHRAIGRYNILSVGVLVWRLKPYSVTHSSAYCVEEEGPQCFTFSVLGHDAPLFNSPQPDPDHVAAEINLPVPIRRLALQEIVRLRPPQTRSSADYYGEGKSLVIYAPDWPVRSAAQPIPREMVIPTDLSDWRYRAGRNSIAVDPVLGRIVFPTGQLPRQGVWVTYHYGFSADIGGGEYKRPMIQPSPEDMSRIQMPDFLDPGRLVTGLQHHAEPLAGYLRGRFEAATLETIDAYGGGAPSDQLMGALIEEFNRILSDDGLYDQDRFAGITLPDAAQRLLAAGATGPLLKRLNRLLLEAAYPELIALSYAIYRVGPNGLAKLAYALEQWQEDKPRYAIIEFTDSSVYAEPLNVVLGAYQSLQIRAANRTRPVLRLLDYMTDKPDALSISGAKNSRFVIDGLLITGRGMSVSGPDPGDRDAAFASDLCEVTIRHCSLIPGWGLDFDCEPKRPNEPSLELMYSSAKVRISHTIIGSIEVVADETATDPIEICINDSIVDATRLERTAIGAPNLPLAFARVFIIRTTVLGQTNVHAVGLAENSILMGELRVAHRQEGCVRFCYLTPGSRTPARYHCQPDLAAAAVDEWVPPVPNNERPAAKAREAARVRPIFNSIRYGKAYYCQLADDCASEIKRGADDESELGAFHDLFEPQRAANLATRLAEYTPAAMEAGILFAQ